MELPAEEEEAEQRGGPEDERKSELVGAETGIKHFEKEVDGVLREGGCEVA